ncbi:MAG: class I adenylate cyclase [Desulfamplus sp.]|nr:class I adenylate cyclase [Desulfamplus sp.]
MKINSFNQEWSQADQNSQIEILERAAGIAPGEGIVPVMAGLLSANFSVRKKARTILDLYMERIELALNQKDKTRGVLDSTLLAAHVYRHVIENVSPHDMKTYFEILLDPRGRAPFYAWKLCQGKMLSIQPLKLLPGWVSEHCRLALVTQYLSSRPSVKRKYADDFLKILKEVSSRQAVIYFYADLFDKEIPYDPFLDNIKLALRNPSEILTEEFRDNEKNTDERNRALKAVAMISEKMNPALLLKLITSKKLPEFKKTAFKIVERSPAGTYFQLTDSIIEALRDVNIKEDTDQAMDIFRAAVISRGNTFGLDMLIHRILEKAPALREHIQTELSGFSRVAMCFIQEMAEDPSGTCLQNSMVHHALICGTIRKRPERVIKMLQSLKISNPASKNAAIKLKKIIASRLNHEKQSIKEMFGQMLKDASDVKIKQEKTGFFKAIFSTTLGEKIESLKQSDSDHGFHFTNEYFENMDMSFNTFNSPAFVDNCIVRNTDISFSSFRSSDFSNTLFHGVKMVGTNFKDTCFEKCIFVDIIADEAQFERCSFTDSSFFRCSFVSASMTDSVMAGCNIAATHFSRLKNSSGTDAGKPGTDLSGATFASSTLTQVHFEEAKLDNTDFAGAIGKFCRFSPHSLSKAETEHSNLGARIFDLSPRDIEEYLKTALADHSIANPWNMMLYTELIHRGKRLFLQKNRYAVTVAFDLFQPHQADLFELIPLLLHENIALCKPSARSANLTQIFFDPVWRDRQNKMRHPEEYPHGIAGYLPAGPAEKVFKKYKASGHIESDGIIFIERRECAVEGLFTIGSIGSIAHTHGSDIDYWVCIQSVFFDHKKLALLNRKLKAIEIWAQEQFKTEIHFFIVDIEDARKSFFGESDSESSGSAQGRILKEEFYRTMIHVAGKLPFWVTLPSKVSKNYYHDLFIMTSPGPHSGDFIDFGDIHDIPAGEYFGASVWQMFKALKSPFKSVLKMGLLEKYIHEKKENRLLICNKFKDHWMNPGVQFRLIKSDPYYILIINLLEYYDRFINKKEFSKLVQFCFFSKLSITTKTDIKTAFGLKGILIDMCRVEWGWEWGWEDKDYLSQTDSKHIRHAGRFKKWSYKEISSKSLEIEKFMAKTYNNVKNALGLSSGKDSLLTARDRTVLGRKMFVQFNRQQSKVNTVLLISRDGLSKGLTLVHSLDSKKNNIWTLMHRWKDNNLKQEHIEKILTAPTIEEIAAWLIHNSLCSDDAYIKLEPNPTHARVNDIKTLLKNMYEFFEPDMRDEITPDALFNGSRITSLFISINFTVPKTNKKIVEYTAVYRNSWGEMFCRFFKPDSPMEKNENVLLELKKELNLKVLPDRYKFFGRL